MNTARLSSSLPPPPPPPQSYYHPIPTDPAQSHARYVVVLPHYYNTPSWHRPLKTILCCVAPLLIAAAVFILWPCDPDVSIERLHLNHLHIHRFPVPSLDITLDATVKIFNRDFFSIDYDSLLVAIGYRGKRLGFVTSEQGHVIARGSSYANATLHLQRVEIISDVIPLIRDLTRGVITFDTVTEIHGQLGLHIFSIPLKGKVSCEIVVNTHDETIEHQNCYPE